jgi:hypothetical protein
MRLIAGLREAVKDNGITFQMTTAREGAPIGDLHAIHDGDTRIYWLAGKMAFQKII